MKVQVLPFLFASFLSFLSGGNALQVNRDAMLGTWQKAYTNKIIQYGMCPLIHLTEVNQTSIEIVYRDVSFTGLKRSKEGMLSKIKQDKYQLEWNESDEEEEQSTFEFWIKYVGPIIDGKYDYIFVVDTEYGDISILARNASYFMEHCSGFAYQKAWTMGHPILQPTVQNEEFCQSFGL